MARSRNLRLHSRRRADPAPAGSLLCQLRPQLRQRTGSINSVVGFWTDIAAVWFGHRDLTFDLLESFKILYIHVEQPPLIFFFVQALFPRETRWMVAYGRGQHRFSICFLQNVNVHLCLSREHWNPVLSSPLSFFTVMSCFIWWSGYAVVVSAHSWRYRLSYFYCQLLSHNKTWHHPRKRKEPSIG